MSYEIANVASQSSSATHAFLKDMILYLKGKTQYVKKLENNLEELTVEITNVYSRKKQIDRTLETSVSKEGSEEYHIFVREIEGLRAKYNKFITKYNKYCGGLPEAMLEPKASIASNIIDVLQEKKPTIKTRNFFMLAKLSKNIKELHNRTSQVAERVRPENMIVDKKLDRVWMKYDDFGLPSFDEYVSKILKYLEENENRSIGIVGFIGVGKTTIMKKLNNQLNENMSLNLDVVIWINYPKELSTKEKIIEMMQGEIMERLKLKEEKANSIEQNANTISFFLSQKKYVVLIDQVSSSVDLKEVGIHKGHRFGKVVITSSNKKIIKQMTDQEVEIKRLSNDDAWNLFENICGRIDDPRIKYIAETIIESCGGLSSVIKLVATYLKGEKDENIWRDAKHMLQSETRGPDLLELGAVGNAYKLVYDELKESYLKKCLLFGALFPSNHKIYKEYLVECWIAEGFLPLSGTAPELRSGREHGATVLRELTDKYLLERCPHNKYVKMPGYFRKVVLEQHPGENWTPKEDWLPREEIWSTVKRMSLIRCNPKLPACPESPNILTLLLQWNPELGELGDSFFLKMKNLRILDLNQAMVEMLPTSISSLVNLISLYLNGCTRLVKLPPEVKMLKKIEFLDIRGTSIPTLPQEIGDMIQLRCLRVSFALERCCRHSKGNVKMMIPSNIISHLKQLEELIIETSCCNPSWKNIAAQIVSELAGLEKLSTLSFHFPSVLTLKEFVTTNKSWRNMRTQRNNTFKSFKISIGCCETWHQYGSEITGILAERQLRFSSNEEILDVNEVLRQASAFELVGHLQVKSLSEFELGNAGALKVCVLESCNSLLSIVDADKTNSDGVLQCLEKLHLFNLEKLQSIWNGSVSARSLSNLKMLSIFGCHELTWILDDKLAKALSRLKHLKVESCAKVVEIVNVQGGVDSSGILQKVKTIELEDLPNLESISRNGSVTWNQKPRITTVNCGKYRDSTSP